MTEAEWLACEEPLALLGHVRDAASDRKLRLFAVELCRRCRHLLRDKPYRRAVDVAERFADGLADPEELAAAYSEAVDVAEWGREGDHPGPLWCAAWSTDAYSRARSEADNPDAPAVLAAAAAMADGRAGAELGVPWAAALGVGRAVMAATLRDIVYGPRSPVVVRASWLTWRDGTVRKLAGAIYDERAFGQMPVLGDALEEAGCDSPEVLSHCRGPSSHARGCFVLDALLGKA